MSLEKDERYKNTYEKAKDLVDRGLSTDEIEFRIENGLKNGDYNVKTKTIKEIFILNIFTLFNLINIILGICVFTTHSYKNMTFLCVVFSNLVIGIVQEIRAKKVIDKMSLLSASKTTVLRNSKKVSINNEEIVQDEIIMLKSGNQVSVDCIVLSGECEMDESLLTGESDTVNKKSGDILLSGSFVVSGTVKTIAYNIGKESYVNTISQKVKYIKKNESEMLNSIKLIIKIVSICIFPLSFMIFYRQLFVVKQTLNDAILSTVASLIGMIPSGLVLLISIVLAVSVIRLSRKHVLVQDMYCIETLARVDVLCLDKTGTLTEGKLKVEDIKYVGEENTVNKELSEFLGATTDENSTIIALRENLKSEKMWEVKRFVPFSSVNKYSLIEYEDFGVYVLGSPEVILGDMYNDYKHFIEKYCSEGKRVLAFVHKYNNSTSLRALVIMGDIVRKNAKETLEYFENEDVKIKIISGDNPVTVMNVAKEAGVNECEKYIDATRLKTEADIFDAVDKYTIFGRVTPNQKLDIVKALKDKGHVVGMTGDGVNDVMALKESDCSIAMQSGSEAARNVSKIVLLKSDFSVLPNILSEGRRSINNLERSASLYLVKTIYSFILAFIFSFACIPYPFRPVQLTLVGACSIGIPSFILAMERNKNRVKGSFLVNVLCKSIPGALMIVTNILAALIIGSVTGATKGQTSTLTIYMTASAAMVVLFVVCYPFSRTRLVMFSGLITALLVAFGVFEKIFYTTTLNIFSFIVIAIMSVSSLVLYHLLSICVERIMFYFVKSNSKINRRKL